MLREREKSCKVRRLFLSVISADVIPLQLSLTRDEEDYKKLEVLAFEMETTIASLEEELGAANQEKEEIYARNESMSSALEMLSDKLDISNTELNALQEEISDMRLKLKRSETSHQRLESQISLLMEEKEELATQLTNALLDLEEERAVWSAKEKASVEAIKEKANAYNDEVRLLSDELSKKEHMKRWEEYRNFQSLTTEVARTFNF